MGDAVKVVFSISERWPVFDMRPAEPDEVADPKLFGHYGRPPFAEVPAELVDQWNAAEQAKRDAELAVLRWLKLRPPFDAEIREYVDERLSGDAPCAIEDQTIGIPVAETEVGRGE